MDQKIDLEEAVRLLALSNHHQLTEMDGLVKVEVRCENDPEFCRSLAERVRQTPEALVREIDLALKEVQSRQCRSGQRKTNWLRPPIPL